MGSGEPLDEDDSEYTLQPEAEPSATPFPRAAPRPLPRPMTTVAVPAKSRSLPPKNPTVELVKIVVGGLVGLMLGFLLLAIFFQVDFNPVLPDEEKTKQGPSGIVPPPPPPASATRPPAKASPTP